MRNPLSFCDPGEDRTLDPMIKSHLLYQLSYRVIYFYFFLTPLEPSTLPTKVGMLYLLSYRVVFKNEAQT